MAKHAAPTSTRVYYMLAVIRALLSQGAKARPKEVYAWIEERGLRKQQISPAGIDADGHYRREVRFARQELADGGIVRTSDGQWRIIDSEVANQLTMEIAREIIRNNRRRREARRSRNNDSLPPAVPLETNALLTGARATTGPVPAHWEGIVTRESGPATTYVFRFGASDVWKVGFAADVEKRLWQINQHVPIELLSEEWKVAKRISWSSADLAYAMEQQVLLRLARYRTMFERVRCCDEILDSAWEEAVVKMRQTEAVSAGLEVSGRATGLG
ncbi:hypothetical protein [Roseibium sp.]|uniref:hypothetical protein n=1 Tax=Roseibium sp. TaxID=1936156 RepID=UPI003A968DD9